MSTKTQEKVSQKTHDSAFWNQAISEAEDRIKKLRFTLRVYKLKRDRGDPWPGVAEENRAGR
jgi:hypothetical protein